jgi:hypothetical protein
MRTSKILLLQIALAASALISNPAWSQTFEPVKHVIVIGVDGMSPDGVRVARTPNMDFLMKNGASTLHARAVLPSSSSPNWASIIMGAGPEQHGILSNGWEMDDVLLPPTATGLEDIFPTEFGVIRQQKPDAEIGAIYHWDGFGRLFEKSAVDVDMPASSELDATNKAVAYINQRKPAFLFIHLDHVDGAGHEHGHGSKRYYEAVTLADSLIGLVIKATRDAGIHDDMLMIVTSDHGGLGHSHGGASLAEMEIPFILFGKGVKKNYEIKELVNTHDNAATVVFALGVNPHPAWIGRAIKSAFVGFPDPPDMGNRKKLSAPAIFPERRGYSPAGGLFVDQKAEVKIASTEDSVVVRYTLDGTEPIEASPVYASPFQLSETRVVKAKAFRGKDVSPTSMGYFRIVESHGNHGLNYRYYETGELDKLPDVQGVNPVRSGKAYEFDLDRVQHRDEQFVLVFEGFLEIKQAGEYKFYTYSDDGSKLFVNGKEVVDNDGNHGPVEHSGEINLQAGLVPIKVSYFNSGGGSRLDVLYRGSGVPKQIIPANLLHRSENN